MSYGPCIWLKKRPMPNLKDLELWAKDFGFYLTDNGVPAIGGLYRESTTIISVFEENSQATAWATY